MPRGKIIFLVQTLNQPRCIKRIVSLSKAGFETKVLGFARGKWRDNMTDYGDIKLARVDSLKVYTKRSLWVRIVRPVQKFWKFLKMVRAAQKISTKDDLVYVFGFELACVLSFFARHRKYVYEEGDMVELPDKGTLAKLARSIDRRIIRHSQLTIFTSEGFIGHTFPKGNAPTNILVQPNKLTTYFKSTLRPNEYSPDINHLRLGFVGHVRYPQTLLRWARVIGERFPQHEYHLWGDYDDVLEEVNALPKYSNVIFHGAYHNPDDLAAIYQTIDVNVCCYDYRFENVRIAEPNKIYESAYFVRPMVVSSNTFLAKKIAQWGIGEAVDSLSDEAIAEYIASLTTDRLKEQADRAREITTDELIDSPAPIVKKLETILL